MIKKQKILILVLTLLFAALIAVYFIVVQPIVNAEEPEVTTAPPETVAGEDIGHNDRYLIFEHIETEEIRSIEVHNPSGSFTFYRDANDDFQIKGHEGTRFDEELFSSLAVSCGYTLAIVKVDDPISNEEYGFSRVENEDGTVWEPSWYKLTTKSGAEHTVYIGYKLVTGGGYYAKYAGREDVYVLSTELAKTILAPLENMIKPMAVYPMSTTNYFETDNFLFMKGDETFIAIGFNSEEERAGEYSNEVYRMLEPKGYLVSSTGYDSVLQTFCSTAPLSCVKLGATDEALEQYNLAEPAYTLYFEYPDPNAGVIKNMLLVSERNAAGNYYVAAPLFDQIVEVSGSEWDFLTWDFVDWVDSHLFLRNIDYIKEIRVESPKFSETFLLEGDGQELVVTQKSNNRLPDVKNFRQFYKTMLILSLEGVAPLNDEEKAALVNDPSKCQLELTFITDSTTLEYKFYPYSERRSYYTINGEGEFYVLRSMVDKVIADADRITRDEPVDSESKYYE